MDILLGYFILGSLIILGIASVIVLCLPDNSDEEFDRYPVIEVDRGEIR